MPDLDATIESLPPECRPENPILTRDELAALGPWLAPAAVNAYTALRGDYGRLASAYVALTAAPPVVLPDPRPSPLAGCRAWILGRLGRSHAGPCLLHMEARAAGFTDSEYYGTLARLQSDEDAVAFVDDPFGGKYRLNTSVVASADADLEIAAGNFRLCGSPFADRRANIPRTVPVPVCHTFEPTFAVYAPDMTVGTLPGENRAGDTLDEMLASPASMPTPGRVRAALAWEDIDDEPEETESCKWATSIKADLAAWKDSLNAHRDASNSIG